MIPALVEVDAVGFEVACDTAVVASRLVVAGGICFTFSVVSSTAFFSGTIVDVARWPFVLLVFVFLATCSFATSSAMATSTPSATGGIGLRR